MKTRSLTTACLFTLSTLLLSAPALATKPAGPNAQIAITPAVQTAVQGTWRDPANVKRDAWRHPAQTLSFFGVAPGKTVIEITPGGGWYAEILGPLLHEKGAYVAAVVDPMAVPEGRGRDYSSAAATAWTRSSPPMPRCMARARSWPTTRQRRSSVQTTRPTWC